MGRTGGPSGQKRAKTQCSISFGYDLRFGCVSRTKTKWGQERKIRGQRKPRIKGRKKMHGKGRGCGAARRDGPVDRFWGAEGGKERKERKERGGLDTRPIDHLTRNTHAQHTRAAHARNTASAGTQRAAPVRLACPFSVSG